MWQMQGHGIPQYLNFDYPFPVDPPYVPKENPTGCYRKQFQCEYEKGDYAFLVFEGVDSAFYCWLNGKYVGYSQDSRLPAEFDVSKIIYRNGRRNTLVVQVMKWSDGSYLEDQDMWRVSGIHRSVRILFKPHTYIQDFQIRPMMTFDSDGNLAADPYLDVEVDVVTSSADSVVVEARIYDLADVSMDGSNNILGFARANVEPVWLAASFQGEGKHHGFRASMSLKQDSVQLWSAEIPHCYIAVLSLVCDDMTLEHEGCIVGYRKNWISKEGQLLHNGRPIMLQGVNRHEHCPKSVRIVTSHGMKQDATVMKQLNFNAVRCSHYPNHDLWYSICAVWGLYVVDEANVETHGFDPGLKNNRINPTCSSEWLASIVDRGVRMYERDKNFPCIICWSLGNEAGYGPAHLAMAGYIRAQDATRPIQYEGGGSQTPATDIICPMYARVDQVRKLASDPKEKRPVILCEYAHSMGNSTGNVHKYWKTFHEFEKCQGGFVWDWVDQALWGNLRLADGQQVSAWLYGGDFGDTPNDGQFICNGVVFPDRALKPASFEMKHVQRPIETRLEQNSVLYIQVINRHSFLDIHAHCIGTWRIRHNGVLSGRYGTWNTLDTGLFVQVSPGVYKMPLDVLPAQLVADQPSCSIVETCVEVQWSLKNEKPWARAAHIIAFDQMVVEDVYINKASPTKYITLREQKNTQCVTFSGVTKDGNDVHLSIDNNTGEITSYIVAGVEILENPIQLCLYRAPTDNDRGGSGGKSYASRWKAAGLNSLETTSGSCLISRRCGEDNESIIDCSFEIHSNVSQMDSLACQDEGVGVGEVGGAHWFAEEGQDVECISPSETKKHNLKVVVSVQHMIQVDGTLESRWDVDCTDALPQAPSASLARVGIACAIPRDFNQVTFYGRGPHENYCDRNSSAHLGKYTMDIQDLHVPYVFPGECGGRTDVRWVSWKNQSTGMSITASLAKGPQSYGQFSSSVYSLGALETSRHDVELQPDTCIHVHLDAAHMGVGGDDSWSPTVHEEYLVPPSRYAFTVSLSASTQDPQDVWTRIGTI